MPFGNLSRKRTADSWVLLMDLTQGVPYFSSVPTLISFSTAGKPAI